jgi:acetyltransferase-like isoleucine patch superfamily enzyme
MEHDTSDRSMGHSELKKFKIERVKNCAPASRFDRYAELVIGRKGFAPLLRYELVTGLVSCLPGAFGMVARARLYPYILGHVGRNVIFGKNILFRHPHKIHVGDNCVIDDNCLLDAKGTSNQGIRLGDGVYVGRNTILSCKDGDIELGDNVNLGFNCEIFSSSKVVLEEYVLVAAYSYILGGGGYDLRVTGLPIAEQPFTDARGVVIEKNCWLAARVTVLDGSRIGHDSAIGASSVVRDDIPAYSIAIGAPAAVKRKRDLAAPAQ